MSELVSAALDAYFGLMDPADMAIAKRRDAVAGPPSEYMASHPETVSNDIGGGAIDVEKLLRRPTEGAEVPLGEETRSGEPLFVLTNRLNPFSIASRVLMNMTLNAGPPKVTEFNHVASACAREVGLRLREDDRKQNSRGGEKRAVAWPVGEDEKKSRERFAWSFLLWPGSDSGSVGPLGEMGLATIANGTAVLTERGALLASTPSSLLGEEPGWTLSSHEQTVLRAALAGLVGEMEAVLFFLETVRSVSGAQPRVERALMKRHQSWSPNRVTAHRAAMIGRLRDIDMISVSGSGPSAVIEIKTYGVELLRKEASEEAVL
jgi:hypothetical protein